MSKLYFVIQQVEIRAIEEEKRKQLKALVETQVRDGLYILFNIIANWALKKYYFFIVFNWFLISTYSKKRQNINIRNRKLQLPNYKNFTEALGMLICILSLELKITALFRFTFLVCSTNWMWMWGNFRLKQKHCPTLLYILITLDSIVVQILRKDSHVKGLFKLL